MEYTRELLEAIGLEGQRIQMFNVSSAMGGQFAESAAELTEEIRNLGPNPLRNTNGGLQVDDENDSSVFFPESGIADEDHTQG